MSTRLLLSRLTFGAIPAAGVLGPTSAHAHVKWFCAYDVAGSPVSLANVLCQDLELLVALSIGLLMLGFVLEGSPLGGAILRAFDAVTGPVQRHTELIVRVVAGGFFVALWSLGNVLLTPELRTGLSFVPWLQLAIAACMLSRRTLPLASAGIVALFLLAINQYGLFHLLDYPVFLGLAAYLTCVGLQRSPWSIRPLDIVRYAAAVTLMWASVEKWAYPQWTYPIFAEHPEISMGFDIAFYMRAAGAVEFALAFALLGTPLVRRTSAILLSAIFLEAINDFGMIDAIGHSCIIAALLAIAADNARTPVRGGVVWLAPVAYSTALAGFLTLYYGLHSALFGTAVG